MVDAIEYFVFPELHAMGGLRIADPVPVPSQR